MIEGGLPVAEITFRTAAAAEVIGKLSAERPELITGAGTVLNVENLERAKACGAKFAVAPGFNPEVIKRAQEIGLPICPGVVTPSEIEQTMALGCMALKFFPAEAAGGVKMIKALNAPYAHSGVKLIPTGGVTSGNITDYLSIPCVMAVGGTWIATKEDLAQGHWQMITDRCKAAMEIVHRLRHGVPA